MDRRKISMSEIVLGKPLRWDVYDAQNHLLLTQGFVVQRAQQVDALLERGRVERGLMERGLFVKVTPKPWKANAKSVEEKERPSALRLINQANQRLESLLSSLPDETDVEGKVLEIVTLLTCAVDINRDVALACILVNQDCNYAVRHCTDTAIVSLLMARSMEKPLGETRALMAAALTMNVGMLALQQELHGREGSLTASETELIRRHPRRGVNILRHTGINDPVWLDCVLDHHENEDGSGYPNEKTSQEIAENAKILAIADRYCARVSVRGYRKRLLPNAALRDILLAERKNIDPSLAAILIRELGTYPPGTFVRLKNGEIGVVTARGATTTTPIVHALVGPFGEPLAYAIKRDTAAESHCIREVLDEQQAAIYFTMQQLWGDAARL